MARQLLALGLHPALEIGQHRRAQLLACGEALLGGLAVDPALDVEQQVDPLHRLQRHGRDRRRVLAASLAGHDVGELEELPPGMRPTRCLGDRPRRSSGRIEAVVAGVGVSLEDPGEAPQMLDRVIAGPVPRVAEQRRRRVRTAERRVVADIDPGPPGGGLALGQHRHRRVVTVQALRRQHMRRDQIVQRPQRHRAGADLVGQRRTG